MTNTYKTLGNSSNTIDGVTVSGVPTSGQSIVATSATAATWQTVSGGSFTAGGDLSGTSSSQTVIKLQGNAVASGTNGAGQDGYVFSWVNSGSDYQLVKYAGDVTGSPGASVVSKISGSSPLAITPASLSWLAATASPTITQATPTTDVATQNLTFTSQAPFASATTNKAPGGMVFKIPAMVSGNFTNMFSFQAGVTTNLCTIGDWNSSGTAAIWLGTTATFGASTLNFALLGGATTVLNGSAAVSLRAGNTVVQTITAGGTQFASSLRQQEITTAATTYVALTTDCVIFTDSTSNAVAITLPVPTTGLTITVKDKTGQAATHNVTINHHASETIDGAASYVLNINFASIVLVSDGTNWAVTASYNGTVI